MGKVSIAIDIGASSGRIITGTLQNGKILIREIFRFKNSIVHIGEHDYWDIDAIFRNIKLGLGMIAAENQEVQSIGIDTWGVDYVLLDEQNQRLSPVFSYRDHRTDHALQEYFSKIEPGRVYAKTGIQFQQYNTIYQLQEHVKFQEEIRERARDFLMVPDYLNYLLCGKKTVEFTNATTTQLFNVHNHEWDEELIKATGLSKEIFPEVVEAGTILGAISKEIQVETGLPEIKVIAPATHDTGSAVVSVPSLTDDFAYISSGTWSLMGIESRSPICTEKAGQCNFTNEGGVFRTYRVLKNIMGLWLIQEAQRKDANTYGFEELESMAQRAEPFKSLINPNHPRFLNPENMIEEIRSFCMETNQPVPDTAGEIARCIFESLAFQYRKVLAELRDIQSQAINRIHIIGGGSRNKLLNQLCADFTGCEVLAGPVEATALGNLAVQFIALGELESLIKAREVILDSFEVESYHPVPDNRMEEQWDRFLSLIQEDLYVG